LGLPAVPNSFGASPTQIEDKIRAAKIDVAALESIRQKSLELINEIIKYKNTNDDIYDNEITHKSENLYKNFYSIQNIGLSPGWLFCETFADKPLYIWKEYINRHGPNSKKEKLPIDLYNIGFNFLIAQYYKSVGLCDNYVKEYKEKRP
jgi:hypothetical protein